MTIQELVAEAAAGDDKAREQAWAKVGEARAIADDPKQAGVLGQEYMRTIRQTIAWASGELQRTKRLMA